MGWKNKQKEKIHCESKEHLFLLVTTDILLSGRPRPERKLLEPTLTVAKGKGCTLKQTEEQQDFNFPARQPPGHKMLAGESVMIPDTVIIGCTFHYTDRVTGSASAQVVAVPEDTALAKMK